MTMLLITTLIVTLCAPTAFAVTDVAKGLPTPWTSQGCRTEANGVRALQGASYANSTGMTEQSCISFCSDKGFVYAGGT